MIVESDGEGEAESADVVPVFPPRLEGKPTPSQPKRAGSVASDTESENEFHDVLVQHTSVQLSSGSCGGDSPRDKASQSFQRVMSTRREPDSAVSHPKMIQPSPPTVQSEGTTTSGSLDLNAAVVSEIARASVQQLTVERLVAALRKEEARSAHWEAQARELASKSKKSATVTAQLKAKVASQELQIAQLTSALSERAAPASALTILDAPYNRMGARAQRGETHTASADAQSLAALREQHSHLHGEHEQLKRTHAAVVKQLGEVQELTVALREQFANTMKSIAADVSLISGVIEKVSHGKECMFLWNVCVCG